MLIQFNPVSKVGMVPAYMQQVCQVTHKQEAYHVEVGMILAIRAGAGVYL